MSFVQVVQAFTADTPDQPLDVWVLPRAPGGDEHFFNPHVPHPLPKRGPIDAVPIAQQIPRGLVPWEGLDDLLGGPLRGGMFGDVNADDPSSLVGQHHEDKEYFVGDRWHDKEIQGHEVLHVVL